MKSPNQIAFTAVVGALLLAAPSGLAQFSQQGSKLVGAGAVAPEQRGQSVSVSADGNTVIVGGGFNGGDGKAWIWTRSGEVWSQQGSNLLGSDAAGNARQGYSVGISDDGDTAIVGGFSDSVVAGATWIWTRIGESWSQQGPKLFGSGGVGPTQQGYSVALSADGNTAISGGKSDNYNGVFGIGAAWIWTRSSGVWSQQGPKLVGSPTSANATQGFSVGLSDDGNTAIVGGFQDNGGLGAAWIWTRSGGVWTQQGKLVGAGTSGPANQGSSVALSGDGNTAIVGGNTDHGFAGAAWVWVRSEGVWTQQGSKLFGAGAVGNAQQGTSVSLSYDGNTAIVGGPQDNGGSGAAWIWTRSGGVWTQQGKLVGAGAVGNSGQGNSVSLSADGNTAVIGGPSDDQGTGAVWIFAEAPLLPPPSLIGPASTGLPASPPFSWLSVNGASTYRLMVATTAAALPSDPAASSCSGCAINALTATNYYIPSTPLSTATTYYWQVQGRNSTGGGIWSTRSSFTTAAAGAIIITGMSPNPIVGSDSAQILRIFGVNFEAGMTVTLTNTLGGESLVRPTLSLTSTQASVGATLPAVDATWTAMVANPGGGTSGAYSFRVIPPGAIGGDLQASRITIDPFGPTQTVGVAFPITIKTVDAGGVVLAIDADIRLVTNAGAVHPSLVRISSGVGSAQISIDSPGCDVELQATGAGASGISSRFAVEGAGQGSVTGRILREDGTAIEGAAVMVTGCDGSSVSVPSVASGRYTMAVAAGKYQLIATHNGKASDPVEVTVAANSCSFVKDIQIENAGSPCNPNGLTPILFVPGIMGSTTKNSFIPSLSFPSLPAHSPSQQAVPPYETDADWAPGPAPYLDGLYYSRAGVTEWDKLALEISLRNPAYRKVVPGYGGLVPNPCLVIPVPYDWRKKPDEAAQKYLIPRIKSAKANAGVSKVHIVAHSMGGLVARSYIQSTAYVGDVHRLAMVGTPNEGAEIAYLLAEGGNPLRADMVSNAATSIGLEVYKNVLEDLYQKSRGGLGVLIPSACRFWSVLSTERLEECARLRQRPEDSDWTDYRKAMKQFLKREIPSIGVLLPINRAFLVEGAAPARGLGCDEFRNQFLVDLNAAAPASDLGEVTTMVFGGIQRQTVDRFVVSSRRSNCLADTLSPDGEFRGFSATTDGDGTVRRASVLSSSLPTGMRTQANLAGKHVELLAVYQAAIADFLFDLPTASVSTSDEAQGLTPTIHASITAPDLELRIAGRARPYLVNGIGQGCGLKPGTSEIDQTLPGCTSIVAQPLESVLGLTGIPNGVYNLTLTSMRVEDSDVSATVSDGSEMTDLRTTVFCEAGSRGLIVTVAAGTATPIRIDGPTTPATALTAVATGTPRTTTLSWSPSTDPAVVGYTVYGKQFDEPKLTLLAQVSGTEHATSHPWADAIGVQVRNYAVAARLASGQTSILTELVTNDDRDHDGLSDVTEGRYHTDADNADTDGDALRDGEEIAIGSDPLNPDTDGDGFPDGLEGTRGSDPLEPGSTPVALQTPANVVATATSSSQVQLLWGAVAGAEGYEVFRSSNQSVYELVGTSAVNGLIDSAVTANTTYLYTVRAIDSTGGVSAPSNADLATTVMFIDDPLFVRSSMVKAVHMTQLRSAVNAVRAAAGLPPSAFSSDMAPGLSVRATHVNELRLSLNAARTALGLSVLEYHDTAVGAGTTRISEVHISSLRDGVK